MVSANDKVIVEMHLSGGECHDGPEGRLSIKKVGTNFEGVPILMDRAYEGDKTRKLAKLYGHDPVVPPKKNRIDPWEYDKELYKKRNMGHYQKFCVKAKPNRQKDGLQGQA